MHRLRTIERTNYAKSYEFCTCFIKIPTKEGGTLFVSICKLLHMNHDSTFSSNTCNCATGGLYPIQDYCIGIVFNNRAQRSAPHGVK